MIEIQYQYKPGAIWERSCDNDQYKFDDIAEAQQRAVLLNSKQQPYRAVIRVKAPSRVIC